VQVIAEKTGLGKCVGEKKTVKETKKCIGRIWQKAASNDDDTTLVNLEICNVAKNWRKSGAIGLEGGL
jgi:hypothetical protein